MELRVVVGAGQRYDVDGGADPGGFQDVAGAVDGAEVDRDVAGETDDVTRHALWSHSMGVPPVRWVPELSGAVNPAWVITYAVRPEQSKPIWVPQELYWPPPRAQPLVGAGGTRAAPGGATDTAQTVNDGNGGRGDPAAEPGP